MIIQYVFIVLIILAALLIIIGIYVICQGNESGFLLILCGIVCVLASVVVITTKDSPTKQDVLDGKAIYQETQIITGNDTIKTYDIIWKQ